MYTGNGFGKLAGTTQVKELGNIESPHCAHQYAGRGNNHQCGGFVDALAKGNEEVQSVNAVVGETNDGYLNDIRGRYVTETDVLRRSIRQAPVLLPKAMWAPARTVCFGFKGGIGTASRVLPQSLGGYTVGVLVQTNFGVYLRLTASPWEKN